MRKTISKAVRFEVFKRDKFKCQYCGAVAPQVLLQIDHIQPVAKGGANDILNLVTSCFDCNNGKRAKLLTDDTKISKQKQQLDLLQERRDQLEMMMLWHQGLKNLDDDILNQLKKYWESLTKTFTVNELGQNDLKKLLKKYNLDEILKAMDVATQYFDWHQDRITADSCQLAFSKIGPIINVERALKDKPDLKDFFYIRGILKNRLNFYDPRLTMEWLEIARGWGATIDELKQIAISTRNWTSFSDDIDTIIEKYRAKEAEDDNEEEEWGPPSEDELPF